MVKRGQNSGGTLLISFDESCGADFPGETFRVLKEKEERVTV